MSHFSPGEIFNNELSEQCKMNVSPPMPETTPTYLMTVAKYTVHNNQGKAHVKYGHGARRRPGAHYTILSLVRMEGVVLVVVVASEQAH